MEASIVDLRYRMKDILQALDRNETVKIYYHGKLKGIIQPSNKDKPQKNKKTIQDHPFFGMSRNESEGVDMIMNQLRGDRYHDI